ncbi:MAG TPA: hypothetical protein VJP85_10265 [Candidatus Baltobacteraceae bacterium]|nr:hypothetical protein [Candidatus Baltobacteraceae bacterium]
MSTLGGFRMDTMGENRAKRLADALSAVSKPLAGLFEYEKDLAQYVSGKDEIQLLCLAALLRARARAARLEIVESLTALEDAATKVAGAR